MSQTVAGPQLMCGPDRPRGRPRNPAIDAAAEHAALDLLADSGFESLTMEAVAARAGVAKATLYRRFANRDALLCAALGRLNDDVVIPEPNGPNGPDVRDALRQTLRDIRQRSADSPGTRVIMRLILDGRRFPHLRELVITRVLIPRQERLRALLGQAQQHHLVRADLDVDAAIALLIGPMVWLGMLQISEAGTSTSSVVALQESALGLSPDASGCDACR